MGDIRRWREGCMWKFVFGGKGEKGSRAFPSLSVFQDCPSCQK